MSTTTKEPPILFSGPMVRAILEGRKTQTRRVIKPQPASFWEKAYGEIDPEDGRDIWWLQTFGDGPSDEDAWLGYCPYGQRSDYLWVRETWAHPVNGNQVVYRATYPPAGLEDIAPSEDRIKWRPSIFMQRWASRITLEVTEVRVQRLQEISEEDAIAEGMPRHPMGWSSGTEIPIGACPTAREAFRITWNCINSKRGFSWDENPWVWTISFRKVRP